MVNIGCGPLGHPDWINFDYGILAFLHRYSWIEGIIFHLNLWPGSQKSITYDVQWPKNLRLRNCSKPLPFQKNSVDYIFSSHFFEHVKKYEVIRVLKSCYNCLKPGGTIRISIPDLDFIVKQYQQGSNRIERVDLINDHVYALGEQSINQPNLYEKFKSFFMRGHQWMYNFEYFKEMLIAAGFQADLIVRCEPRQGRVPNINMLDCHEEESIFLEATK